MNQPLKIQSILPRIDGILKEIEVLRSLDRPTLEAFLAVEHAQALGEYHLRRALEGVLNIGAHILSRLNGGRAREYKEIARKLGEYNIVDRTYAEEVLEKMAGFRNRLTHFYSEVTGREVYDIIHNHLDDFQPFIKAVRVVLEHPEKYKLTLE